MMDEVKNKALGYITAAFGLVAALAWNEAIKALIDSVFPAGDGLLAKFIYAGAVTVVVVVVTVYLLRVSEDKPRA